MLDLRDSSAYQLILEEDRQEGQVQHGQRTLLRQGSIRFGESDVATESALRAITDIDRLDRLATAVLTASSWQELLATP